MIPFQIIMIPLFIIVRSVPLAGGNDILGHGGTGWLNTYPGLVVPWIASGRSSSAWPSSIRCSARASSCLWPAR